MKKYDFDNFHNRTQVIFTACSIPDRPADFESNGGSRYWDTGNGVIRASSHWGGGIKSCSWYIDSHRLGAQMTCHRMFTEKGVCSDGIPEICGFAAYRDFREQKHHFVESRFAPGRYLRRISWLQWRVIKDSEKISPEELDLANDGKLVPLNFPTATSAAAVDIARDACGYPPYASKSKFPRRDATKPPARAANAV